MKFMTAIGMAFIVLALSGCVEKREFTALEKKNDALANEVAFLDKRMKAVEEICLQLNTRLVGAETRVRTTESAAAAKSDSGLPGQDKKDAVESKSDLFTRQTRATFSKHMVGMSLADTLASLGKPAKVTEEGGVQNWVYDGVVLSGENGKVDTSPALVVFENGAVSRAVLMESVEYSSQPKEGEPTTNTAVKADK